MKGFVFIWAIGPVAFFMEIDVLGLMGSKWHQIDISISFLVKHKIHMN